MENDVRLLQQLLALGDSIQELKSKNQHGKNVQYFSRKNSVLRIPIPPRSSNRMCANKRIPRRLSELTRPPHPSYSEPNSAMQSPATYGTTVARLSNGSIDSGIRDGSPSSPSSGSPSPTFIQAKLE
uniref:Uncharacterized protein n=1 Tax=Parascaris equorum TaxID=6256 RepID=A0A914S187_PAREQ